MASTTSLDALQLDIEKLSSRIDSVEADLLSAEQSAAVDRVAYLRNKEIELRKEKNELRKQINILLQANVPGQCDAYA